MTSRPDPVVRVGEVEAVIDPALAAAVTALREGGLLDGAALLGLAPNDPGREHLEAAS